MEPTYYTCLNFLESTEDPKLCSICKQTREKHPMDNGTWMPPPIDDEYREKRSIETIVIGPKEEQ